MMTLLRRAAVLPAALLIALAGSAAARDATPAERTALGERVAAFETAVVAGDAQTMMDIVPPRVMPAAAAEAGIPLEAVRAQVVATIDGLMAAVTRFTFDIDFAAARYLELPDGTPYAMIPSVSFIVIGGAAVRTTADTLALLDEGVWYLVRTDEAPQVQILQRLYPLFAAVVFPAPVIEVTEP